MATATRPSCAASHYMLGMATKDSEESRALRSRAAQLDPGYVFDLSRAASGFPNRQRRVNSNELRALFEYLEQLDPNSEKCALAEVAIGLLYAEAGSTENARRLLDKQTRTLRITKI